MSDQAKDTMRDMCIAQGYVPPKCYLTGIVVWHLVNKGEDPCAGCNLDRAICEGRGNQSVEQARDRRWQGDDE